MLTKADDFPIHQRPEPVACAGTDRNFYDRYFFNGYPLEATAETAAGSDGPAYFAAALGVYPHLNVMDASFAVTIGGVQHNLHASRLLNSERLDTHVGPIEVEVVEPLQALKVRVGKNEHELAAELTFRGRSGPIEEPRFTHRIGPRTILDYTRMTQNGTWEGWIEVQGRRFEIGPEAFVGTRDRSWGIRPVGAPDPQPVSPPPKPQFYWLWTPLNFGDRSVFYARNEAVDGTPWASSGLVVPDGGQPVQISPLRAEMKFRSGTRHAESATLRFETTTAKDGEGTSPIEIRLEPQFQFYMAGLGYMNPVWGHGVYKGDPAVGYEAFELATLKEGSPLFLHVQTLCRAEMTEGGESREGIGVLEQLIIGPHEPSGFNDLLDVAP